MSKQYFENNQELVSEPFYITYYFHKHILKFKSDNGVFSKKAVDFGSSLLLKNELPIQRLVGHHFFSGKWCPQPMLENDLEIWKEFVELTRQQMSLYQDYSQYKLSFDSSSAYLKDNGRVSELPDYTECVTYTVTYTDGTTTKTVTLSTILPGMLE